MLAVSKVELMLNVRNPSSGNRYTVHADLGCVNIYSDSTFRSIGSPSIDSAYSKQILASLPLPFLLSKGRPASTQPSKCSVLLHFCPVAIMCSSQVCCIFRHPIGAEKQQCDSQSLLPEGQEVYEGSEFTPAADGLGGWNESPSFGTLCLTVPHISLFTDNNALTWDGILFCALVGNGKIT